MRIRLNFPRTTNNNGKPKQKQTRTKEEKQTTTQTTTARTTQQDGSSALTYTYINNCSVKIDPNTQGITLYELFVTVDYTPAGYGNTVNGVTSANIGKVNGVATASISKVNGI